MVLAKIDKVQKYQRIWKQMMVNGLGRYKLGQAGHSWQWEQRTWLYSDLLKALKGEPFTALGSQQRGP